MKILIYQPRISYYVGGGEMLAMDHACFLAKMGHEVEVVTIKSDFIKITDTFYNFVQSNKNLKIHYIEIPLCLKDIYKKTPGHDWKRWDIESLELIKLAKHIIDSSKADIFTCYNFVDVLALPREKKTVVLLLGYPTNINYLHEVLSQIDTNHIAVSSYVKQKWSVLLSSHNISVSRNGLDSDKFRDNKAKKTNDIFYVGRMISIKGIQYLIKSIVELKKEYLNIKVLLAGDGPHRKRLEKLSEKLNLKSNITFLRRITEEEKIHYYNISRISVFPSYDREGILITMLESSCCGTPVLTTTACSMKEFIKNGINGFMVQPKSSKAISDKIKYLFKNPELLEKTGNQSRKDVVSHWDWSKKIKDLEKNYEEIISNN